jgi:light-regulated signal transduction histidine kinase (bacteriophytochrome)
MNEIQELHATFAAPPRLEKVPGIQAAGYFIELSLDWIVLRASENVHHLLGQSHVTLIDEPLGRFVHAQALHDLRNLFSRLSGTTGIARAYRVRLTDEHALVDIAFQLSDGRVILEAVPSEEDGFGQAFGTVGGLAAGLATSDGAALLDAAARRMRALTGYDRVTLACGELRAVSSRGDFAGPADMAADLPVMIADCEAAGVPVFRHLPDAALGAALLRALAPDQVARMRDQAIRAVLRVGITLDGERIGEFRCDSRTPRRPSFELHAAAELFAQLFAMRLKIDRLRAPATAGVQS